MLPVAILAGGLATRLQPITEKIPKALVNVAGSPFIIHQLKYLHRQGIRNVVLCVGHLGEMIVEVIGNGQKFGLEVTYSEDGPSLLGTGGALKKALPLLEDEFFVLYGDSYLPISFKFAEMAWRASNKKALMTVMCNNGRWDRSNVIFKDGQLVEYNKKENHAEMNYIDYGLGILSKEIFNNYNKDQPFDLADVYFDLSSNSQLVGHEVKKRFYEIGSRNGLRDLEEYFFKEESK